MKKSKVLRFREKMNNVRMWKENALIFFENNGSMIENPLN